MVFDLKKKKIIYFFGPACFFWYFFKKHYGSLLLPKPIDPRVAVLEALGNGFLLEYHGSTTDRQAPIGNFASRVKAAPDGNPVLVDVFWLQVQEATTEKISDIITKKFSPTTNQPTNLIPHYKGVMCV